MRWRNTAPDAAYQRTCVVSSAAAEAGSMLLPTNAELRRADGAVNDQAGAAAFTSGASLRARACTIKPPARRNATRRDMLARACV